MRIDLVPSMPFPVVLAKLHTRMAVALEPEQARVEILTATLPEARARERVDHAPTVLTIDVLGDEE